MKVIDHGHHYELASLDGEFPQQLVFVKRDGPGYPGNVGHHPGTTLQDVLRCVIGRAQYLNSQIPCAETDAAIGLLEGALVLFELRAKRVKGKVLEARTVAEIVLGDPCPKCMHVQCTEDHL